MEALLSSAIKILPRSMWGQLTARLAIYTQLPVMRYFEDFHPGQVIDVGSVAVTEADIIAFARQYDPQPMHIDPHAAGRTIYGGLIASGWHTVSLFMRLLVENLVAKMGSLRPSRVAE